MRLFGFTIARVKDTSVPVTGSWWPIWPVIRESWGGAWQHNVELSRESVVTHSAVYACVTLIASDIAKMRLRLMQQDSHGIWRETENPAFSPVLRRPNPYQLRIQFVEWWVTSKLLHGNSYALKARDGRGVVVRLYLLDPTKVRPLIAPNGEVFYSLSADNLSQLPEAVVVPAREIIHDRMVPLYHPLMGVSPIHACAMASIQALKIQANATAFFSNGSQPGGVLTAPGQIAQATADRLKTYWETNFGGDNVGKIAVLGDGLKYEPMTVNAVDSQLIEQLRWTAETVCSTFHVPPYMIGVAPPPNFNNIEALNQQYYAQGLQMLIETLEQLLDEGLGLGEGATKALGTEFDLDDLLRMDTRTMIQSEKDAVGAGIKAPNEARARLNLPPVEGGASPYLQQQNFSLVALNRRDQAPAPSPTAPTPTAPAEPVAATIGALLEKALEDLAA